MTWINSDFTIDDAIGKGFATWDLLISNWGNSAASPVELSFPSPGQRGLPTVYGVAIGDQSEVDRCFVSYSIEKMTPGNVTWDVAHRVSVRSPLIFPQIGQREIVQAPTAPPINPQKGNSTVVIYPTGTSTIVGNGGVSPTLFPATYKKSDGSVVAFPPATPGAKTPLLHLVFYLKPPVAGAPTHRAPWAVTNSTTIPGLGGVEHLIQVVPSFGRKRFTIDLRAFVAGAHTIDYRIALLRNCGAIDTVGEYTVATAAGISTAAPGIVTSFTVNPLDADFVMVYATPSAALTTLQYAAVLPDD